VLGGCQTQAYRQAQNALTGVTAYQMLHRVAGAARLQAPGAAVLVHAAAGGTGAMLVQLAKLAGVAPGKIVGTCSAKNLGAVRALGVAAVSYEDAGWPAAARAAAGVAGFAAVFDSVALQHHAAGVALLNAGGIYVAYGLTSKEDPGSVPAVALFALLSARHLVLHSCFGAADALFYNVKDRRDALPDEYAADARALVDLVADGRLEVVVGATHAVDGVKAALQAIAAGTHRGKQCVRVAQ
jgi:NADPH2:quinone reductase